MAIKLQCLTFANAGAAGIDRVRRWLEAQGVRVTSSGSRSISAEIEPDVYRRFFGEPPSSPAKFTASVGGATSLPVPAPIDDVVELITLVPRHDIH